MGRRLSRGQRRRRARNVVAAETAAMLTVMAAIIRILISLIIGFFARVVFRAGAVHVI